MKTKVLIWTFVAGTVLTACGPMKQDPTEAYPELQNSIPQSSGPQDIQPLEEPKAPEVPKPRPQAYLHPELYDIRPDSDVNFIEGRQNSFEIQARIFMAGVNFEMTGNNLPPGAVLSKHPQKNNTWVLTWRPDFGFIPQDADDRPHEYSLELKVVSTPDAATAATLAKVHMESPQKLTVRRTNEQPTLNVSGLPEQIKEGTLVNFTIDVKDPASYEGFAPKLVVDYDGFTSNETDFESNGASYVRRHPQRQLPEHLDNGMWRFHMVFDTKNNPVPNQVDKSGRTKIDADGLQTRMTFKAFSVTGSSSPEKLVRPKVMYDAAPNAPVSTLGSKALEVEAGGTALISFVIFSPSQRGVVSVDSSEVTGLSTKPAVSCQQVDKNATQNVCQVTFLVPCTASGDLKLNVKAQTVLAGKTQSASLVQVLRVAKKAGHCQAAAARPQGGAQ